MVTTTYKPTINRWLAWDEALNDSVFEVIDKWAALRTALEEKINPLKEEENKPRFTDDEWNDIMSKVN